MGAHGVVSGSRRVCPRSPTAAAHAAFLLQVAIVTAAGYPGEPDKFEKRVMGLLEAFQKLKLPPAVTSRWGSAAAAVCVWGG